MGEKIIRLLWTIRRRERGGGAVVAIKLCSADIWGELRDGYSSSSVGSGSPPFPHEEGKIKLRRHWLGGGGDVGR